MLPLLRTCLTAFVAAQFLLPTSARAQSSQSYYARLLTREQVRDVLHCPFCSHPVSDDPMYFVRTSENLNLAFTELDDAIDAVELLNVMSRAKSHCDEVGYKAAFASYATLIDTFGKKTDADPAVEINGVFKLLHPDHDTPSLLEYVVPPFQPCGRRAVSSGNPGGAKRIGMRWSKR
jgi:hypothetical protein